jgi:hypothetical protein
LPKGVGPVGKSPFLRPLAFLRTLGFLREPPPEVNIQIQTADLGGSFVNVRNSERQCILLVTVMAFCPETEECRDHWHCSVSHRFPRRNRYSLPSSKMEEDFETGIDIVVEFLPRLPALECD